MTEFERGMRRAAEIAKLWANENLRMADDIIRLDPITCNQLLYGPRMTQEQLEAAAKISKRLIRDGAYYAARAHSANDVADAILAEVKPRHLQAPLNRGR